MKLSVLVPTHNEEHYIGKCLNSLLNNKSNDFEIIVSDNNSDDNTIKILKSFNDDRIRIIENKKKITPFENHWRAFDMAEGEFAFFLVVMIILLKER